MAPMRRIGRWMVNALMVLSLLLCVATVVLWGRSYRGLDYAWASGGHLGISLMPDRGSMQFCAVRFERCDGRWRGGMSQWRQNLRWDPFNDELLEAASISDPLLVWHHDSARNMPTFAAGLGAGDYSGLRAVFGPYVPEFRFAYLITRCWIVALALATLPAARAFRFVRLRALRRSQGGCSNCFYNLTGNVSGVCPECGMAVANR
jgi:hypothetical protein